MQILRLMHEVQVGGQLRTLRLALIVALLPALRGFRTGQITVLPAPAFHW
jgi:hypothetical protein